MKKINLLNILFAFFIFQSLFVFAQTGKKAEIKRIDSYCKSVDTFVKKYKSPHLVFADVSDYNKNKSKWKKYNSERAFEKRRETQESYNIAYLWQKKGKIVKTNFTVSSPSGDWAKYVFLYFREDGTLAKSESELRTFVGDFIALQDFYFDRKGRILKKTLEYRDLRTEEPKKPSKDDLEDNSFFMDKTNHFKKTGKLPFASLLKRKQQK